MKSIPQFPRLTRRDVERLLDVHQQLNRARDALEHGNWAGGRPVAALLMSALILVSELYNGAEEAFLRGPAPPPEPSLEAGQVEPAPAAAEATTVVTGPDYTKEG